MADRLCNDITNLILSFMIQLNIKDDKYIDNEFSSYMGSDDELVLKLTNDIFFLRLTSKYWKNIIDNYIEHNYKNSVVRFVDKIVYASSNGHVNILEWFKNNKYEIEFEYSQDSINEASKEGHINVLEWWKNSGYEFNYDEDAIHGASLNGHINVLDWWEK